LAFNVQPVRASGTIYIRADGSIDPPTAPIFSADNITYTLTGNITADADGIVIERDNIVLNGAGYTVTGSGSGNGTTLANRSNVTVNNMTMKNFDTGIYLYSSSGNALSGNNVTNNTIGIWLDFSCNNNVLSGNNATANNGDGIVLESSNNNTLSGNNMTDNSDIASNGVGIELGYSSNNSVFGNNLHSNDGGIAAYNSNDNGLDENNITDNGHGIEAFFSSNNEITGNVIVNDSVGIELSYSSNGNEIADNNVTANMNSGITVGYRVPEVSGGIYYGGCSGTNILKNVIMSNGRGIGVICSNQTETFHNNFENNSIEAYVDTSLDIHWDDGYPSGGNYWSDCIGTDAYRGSYQNVTGSDGIGDTPYVIDENNKDNYPFMQPWTGYDVAVFRIVSAKTVIGEGFSDNLTVFAANNGDYSETFNVTAYENATAIGTQQISLNATTQSTLTFIWNTTGLPCGNYTLSASAEDIQGEVNAQNNAFTLGIVQVSVPGDINGDFNVTNADVAVLTNAYGSSYGDARWNPNADINGNGVVDLRDLVILALHYGQHYP
jgi:parallel beta-helix repeat protein